MRRVWCVAAFVASTLGVAPSSAQTAGEAERLFREGRAALARGDRAVACERFEASHRLDPVPPGPLLNVADCAEREGKLVAAWQSFLRATEVLADGDPRRPIARQRAESLARRVPRLTLAVAAGAPAETRVARGGVPLSLGAPLPWDPGLVTLTVSAPGRPDRELSVTLVEGESRVLVVDPAPLPTAPALPPAPPDGPRRAPGRPSPAPPRSAALAWTSGAVAALGLGVGAVAGLLAMDRARTFDAHCGPRGCDAEGLAAARSGDTLAAVSTVSFAVGAVGGVVLGVSLLLRASPPPADPASARRGAPALAPPAAAGVSVRGSF